MLARLKKKLQTSHGIRVPGTSSSTFEDFGHVWSCGGYNNGPCTRCMTTKSLPSVQVEF
jgi:hypothetical protein